MVTSSRRARDTRAFMVPSGTLQMAAASAWLSPCAPTRMTALSRPRELAASTAAMIMVAPTSTWPGLSQGRSELGQDDSRSSTDPGSATSTSRIVPR